MALMGIPQVQAELEKSYADALREKRQLQARGSGFQEVANMAAPRFEQALTEGAPVNPADVFSAYRTFNASIQPGLRGAQDYTKDQDLLSQIASLAAAQQPDIKPPTIAEQLAARKEGLQIVDGRLVPLEGASRQSLDPKTRQELLDERKNRLAQGLTTDDIDQQLRDAGVLKDTGEKEDIIALIDEILARDLKPLTGDLRAGGVPFFNKGKVKTTKAKIDQLLGYLTLENRQKLQGQGTITDKEQQTLERAASTLGEFGQENEDYVAELKKLRAGLSEGIDKKSEYDEDALLNEFFGDK